MTFDGDLAYFEGTYAGPARAGEVALRIRADGDLLTMTPVTVGGRDVPEGRQEADTLDYRGDMTFSNGTPLLTFEGDGDSAMVLRWDQGAGYTVMTRR